MDDSSEDTTTKGTKKFTIKKTVGFKNIKTVIRQLNLRIK